MAALSATRRWRGGGWQVIWHFGHFADKGGWHPQIDYSLQWQHNGNDGVSEKHWNRRTWTRRRPILSITNEPRAVQSSETGDLWGIYLWEMMCASFSLMYAIQNCYWYCCYRFVIMISYIQPALLNCCPVDILHTWFNSICYLFVNSSTILFTALWSAMWKG